MSVNIDDIIERHESLERQLKFALSSFEKKEAVKQLRQEIINNQKQCPHLSDKYNWTVASNRCPYCGAQLG